MPPSFAIAPRPRLALFTTTRGAVTETFIKAHIEQLPFDITVFYGLRLNLEDESGRRLFPRLQLLERLLRRLAPGLARRLSARLVGGLLRRSGAEVVLAEYGTTGAFVAPACQAAGLPLVVHFHGYDASATSILKAYGDDYRRMFQQGASIVVVSQVMRRALLEMGAGASQLTLNCYGVDPERFQAAHPAERPPTFLAVGRFVDKKAPHLTLRAFQGVVAQVPEARLRFIGDGPLLEPAKQLASELGIAGHVEFLGARGSAEVQQAMREARAFVQHSIVAPNGDMEGAPVAIIEAQMCGLPVVATRHAGIPDVVDDGVTGLLVDEHDIAGMTEYMLRLAVDPTEAASLGSAARARALLRFTLDAHLRTLTALIISRLDWISHAESGDPQSPFGGKALETHRFTGADIVRRYREQCRVEIDALLPAGTDVHLHRCQRTGYGFWRPEGLAGPESLYRALMKAVPTYYRQDRWEFRLAARRVKKSDVCLEVGCGRGFFLRMIEDRCAMANGIELNLQAISTKVCTSNIQAVDLAQPIRPGETAAYDRIFLFHVLEHIEDPLGFIRLCARRLAPNGRLVISVPNDKQVGADSFPDVLNMPPHHMGLWDVEVFRKAAPLCGLQLTAAFTHPGGNSRVLHVMARFGWNPMQFEGPIIMVELKRVH